MLNVREPRQQDVLYLAAHLRRQDIREVHTLRGADLPMFDVLMQGIGMSTECYVWTDGQDLPVAIVGVSPSTYTDCGIVWLLATDAIQLHRKTGIKLALGHIAAWGLQYTRGLHNLVDIRNRLHLRWLNLLGFVTLQMQQVNGEDFAFMHYTPEVPIV